MPQSVPPTTARQSGRPRPSGFASTRATLRRLRVAGALACLSLLLHGLAGCSQQEEFATLELASGGNIRLRLRSDEAPLTVTNFKKLASEGFYDGTTFHLAIPQFMIQGGDPNSKNDLMADDGYGGPGYTIADEPNDLSHVRGAVAMANTRKPDTGGSQFFIIVADTGPEGQRWSEELDGQYTIFAEVVEGMDEVERIANTPTGDNDIPGQEYRPNEDQIVKRVVIEP